MNPTRANRLISRNLPGWTLTGEKGDHPGVPAEGRSLGSLADSSGLMHAHRCPPRSLATTKLCVTWCCRSRDLQLALGEPQASQFPDSGNFVPFAKASGNSTRTGSLFRGSFKPSGSAASCEVSPEGTRQTQGYVLKPFPGRWIPQQSPLIARDWIAAFAEILFHILEQSLLARLQWILDGCRRQPEPKHPAAKKTFG